MIPDISCEYIADIQLNECQIYRNKEILKEIETTISDLKKANNIFQLLDPLPGSAFRGPYALALTIQDNRLIIKIRNADNNHELDRISLALTPFRRIIRDYILICESCCQAIRTGTTSRIEAIDMGRRGLHNEGAILLCERLDGKVRIDRDTARRLFTLLCMLHQHGQNSSC